MLEFVARWQAVAVVVFLIVILVAVVALSAIALAELMREFFDG